MSEAIDKVLADLSAPSIPEDVSFREFLTEQVVTDRGPYSFEGHRAFEEIADLASTRRWTVLSKGEQIGASTLGISLACYHALKNGRSAGYFLPTNKFASEFGATRLNPMIARNEIMADNMGETDRQDLKAMGGGHIYIRGLDSLIGAISIPLDLNLYDEVDFIPEKSRDWAEGRIAHSDLGLQFYFARGENPGSGIDALYEDTDRRKWVVRCPACNHDQVLEDSFPECIRISVPIGWIAACVKCGKPVDRERDGRWIAERPSLSNERIGWRLSQLAIPAISLDFIMPRWARALKRASLLANFKGSVLAKPTAGDLQPVTDEVLTRLRSFGYPMTSSPSGRGPVVWGADCGNRVHVVYGELMADWSIRTFFYEVVDSDRVVDYMDRRIQEWRPAMGLIDARPLLSDARKIFYRHPLTVLLQEFGGDEPEEIKREHEGKEYRVVRAGRDLSLGDTVDDALITEPPSITLPDDDGNPIHQEMNDHLKNLKREKVATSTGTVTRFRKDLPNHFGMAVNNMRLAAAHVKSGGARFVGVLPTGLPTGGKGLRA